MNTLDTAEVIPTSERSMSASVAIGVGKILAKTGIGVGKILAKVGWNAVTCVPAAIWEIAQTPTRYSDAFEMWNN